MAKCQGWCWPAVIYAFLVVVSLVLVLFQDVSLLTEGEVSQMRLASLFFHVIMGVLWTWLLYWLCSNCHNTAAWVVLFLPFFIGLVLLAFGTALLTAFFVGRTVKAGARTVAEAGAGAVTGVAGALGAQTEGFEEYEDDY